MINWSKIYKKYKGLWVALKDDEQTVVGSGKSLKEAITVAEKKGYPNPIVMRVPDKLIAFAGGNEIFV
ncbi:MAG: DUF5678 domain-containing protein [Patescibacteria group bacterium]